MLHKLPNNYFNKNSNEMYGSEEEQSEAIPNNTSQDDLPLDQQDLID